VPRPSRSRRSMRIPYGMCRLQQAIRTGRRRPLPTDRGACCGGGGVSRRAVAWSSRQAPHRRTEPHQTDDPPDLSSNDATTVFSTLHTSRVTSESPSWNVVPSTNSRKSCCTRVLVVPTATVRSPAASAEGAATAATVTANGSNSPTVSVASTPSRASCSSTSTNRSTLKVPVNDTVSAPRAGVNVPAAGTRIAAVPWGVAPAVPTTSATPRVTTTRVRIPSHAPPTVREIALTLETVSAWNRYSSNEELALGRSRLGAGAKSARAGWWASRLTHAARPRSWRAFGPRHLRRQSQPDLVATHRDTRACRCGLATGVTPGETCPSAMASGRPAMSGSVAGRRMEPSSASSPHPRPDQVRCGRW
jgi:hypothetical protein